jgi:hypothetical protein
MLRNHPSITSRVYKTGANRRYSVVSKNEGILEVYGMAFFFNDAVDIRVAPSLRNDLRPRKSPGLGQPVIRLFRFE